MMNRLVNFWANLRASLWLVPSTMIAASLALALILIEIDTRTGSERLTDYPLLFGLGADGSRGMLTAIASSMLTVAALAFTLTLNAVTQASGQFSPRIFRNFLRDRANQFVLGYFVSVFAFCLVVLRTIRGGDELKFVPSFSVIAGLLLALGGVFVLIFFIHHISSSLQITSILGDISRETEQAIERMFPERMGQPAPVEHLDILQSNRQQNEVKIPVLSGGYIQNVDTEGLLGFAERHGVVVRMEHGIGQFAGRGGNLLSLIGDRGDESFPAIFNDRIIRELNDLFSIERHRTIEQDVGFGIRQIVDIALKALSPGVNDTTTAINCVDFLGEIVGDIAGRRMPGKIRSKNDAPLVIVAAPDFQDYVETAFDQIRISGKGNLAVFVRLLKAIAFAADRANDKSRRDILRNQIDLTVDFAEQTLATDHEKKKLSEHLRAVLPSFTG